MPYLPEREILKSSLAVLRTVFKTWVKIERRTSGRFWNSHGQVITIGKRGESDISGWILRGDYIAKSLAIEVKHGDFRPSRIYAADKKRFHDQCNYLREINQQGGVGFWINDPTLIYHILMPVLMQGAKVSLDINQCVVVTHKIITEKIVDVGLTGL